MSELDAARYCLDMARANCHGVAAVYWQAVARECERILARMQGNRA